MHDPNVEDIVMWVKKNRSEVTSSQPRRTVDRLEARIEHLERLAFAGDNNFVVAQANEAFRTIHAAGSGSASILVRSGFLARARRVHVEGDRDHSPRAKPPIANLRRSQGLALRLELALIFLKQCSTRIGSTIPMRVSTLQQDDDTLGLVNLFATGTRRRPGSNYRRPRPAMRARQVENALDILASPKFQLVTLDTTVEGRSKYDTMWLNRETGVPAAKDVARYSVPTSEPVVSVPIAFFTNGWIQVLTDSEMWNWLVWRHRAQMSTAATTTATGLRLDADDRLGIYDLTRDAWDTHQVLNRVGLMTANPGEITSTLTSRGQRFRKEPHEFDLDDMDLRQDAHHAMLSAISALRDDLLAR